MGYYVTYDLSLKIGKRNKARALEIINAMHSDEMLLKHAHGGRYGANIDALPVRERKWYSWVKNPEQPYRTLSEAFNQWEIVDKHVEMRDEDGHAFTLTGSYSNKIGQQALLLEQLAPVLYNQVTYVHGEDGCVFAWIIEDGEYREEDLSVNVDVSGFYESSDDEEEDTDSEGDEEGVEEKMTE